MSGCLRTLAALAALVLLPAMAAAQGLGQVSVDFVRANAGGRHQIVVSALDPSGAPVAGLEQAFAVQFDGQGIARIEAVPARKAWSAATISVVVDASLLQKDALGAVQEALAALGHELAGDDHLRVVATGRKVRTRECDAAGVGALVKDLGELGDSETPLLYDGLYDAVKAASRLGEERESVLLLITRGADGGSDHSLLEVFALARTRARLTPVMVSVLGDVGTAAESDRLQRLATHTAGAYLRVASPVDLAAQLPGVLARGRDRWVLRFDAPSFDAHTSTHRIGLTVTSGSEQRATELAYAAADVLPSPWYTSRALWIVAGALIVIGLAAFVLTRRRQRCLLVHDGDADDGVWYEVFALPATLGAAAGNDLVLADAQVSRNHAVLEGRGRNIELVDLNSENGTFVNGERISRRVLADGDRVALGPDVHLIYEARG